MQISRKRSPFAGMAAVCLRRMVPGLNRRTRGPQRKRLLILRPKSDGLGDLVLFSGVLRHLRSVFADREITLAAAGRILPLVERCPHVDHVVPTERFTDAEPLALSSRWPFIRSALLRLRNAGTYEEVVFWWRAMSPELHAFARSFLPTRLTGIAGDRLFQDEQQDNEAEPSYESRFRLAESRIWDHDLKVNLDFLRFLGAKVSELESVWPEFWLSDTDDALIRRWLAGHAENELKIVCAPCASTSIKSWPVERFAEALNSLPPCTVVLVGTAAQSPEMAILSASVSQKIRLINLAGQTSVRELVATISACDLFLGGDSAPLHMAIALHKPSLGIVGGGHFGRYVPWGNPQINRFVRITMDCYGCNWGCVHPWIRCIQDIPAPDVKIELGVLCKAFLAR